MADQNFNQLDERDKKIRVFEFSPGNLQMCFATPLKASKGPFKPLTPGIHFSRTARYVLVSEKHLLLKKDAPIIIER